MIDPSQPAPGKIQYYLTSGRFLCGLAIALSFLFFAETLSFDFVHDDWGQIIENPAVHSWRGVPQYFNAQVWAGVSPEMLGNYYRPLFLLWLRINDMLFGSHAWAWHLTTILVHLVMIWLVFLLGRRVFKDDLSAGITALIFGLHPAHIEAVTWISGVTEPLAGVLVLGSFLCYLQAKDIPEKRARWLAWSLALYILGMFEKETALVLPLIIAAHEFLIREPDTLQRNNLVWTKRVGNALWCALPYAVPVPAYLALRAHALRGLSHVMTPLALSTIVFTWPSLLWFWIRHLVWPVGLSTFYDLPAVSEPSFSNCLLPAIGVACVGAALVWAARRSREVAIACLWLILPLVPLLNLRVFLRNDFAHDRYLYLPSAGFAMVVTVALRHARLGRLFHVEESLAQAIASLGLAIPMGFATAYQSFYFENNLVFYEHNYRSAPNNNLAKTNLASELGKIGGYDAAIKLYQQVIASDPTFWYANYNLGYTYYKVGRFDEAVHWLQRAIQINPAKPEQYLYLGLAQLKMNHVEEATEAIRQAVRLQPEGYGYHFALGMVLKVRGDYRGALQEFQEELRLNPQQINARQQIEEIQRPQSAQ